MGASLRISIKDKKGKKAEVVFGNKKEAKKAAKEFDKAAQKFQKEVDDLLSQVSPKKKRK